MSTRKKVAPTNDDLLKQFDDLEDELSKEPAKASSKGTSSKASKAAPSQDEQDLLAELENLGAEKPASRPHTPRVGTKASPVIKRTATGTPPPTSSNRSSEDKNSSLRKSGESTRSYHTSFTPSATSSDLQEAEKKSPVAQAAEPVAASSGSSWWGGLIATASAVVKDIQQNEEAKRWAEQVKGNVGALQGLGGELRSRALPTFTAILHTVAPPISSHEKLQIHITHDFINYPSISPITHTTFSRVMAQVEGGDLLVIQRAQESGARRSSDAGQSSSNGWSDGPWWRTSNEHRDLGAVKGLTEGTKLVRVSAEAYATEYFERNGGLEAAAQRATEDLSESNPVRSSDIFLGVQAIIYDSPAELFQGPTKDKAEESVVEEEKSDELVVFALYLYDPVHTISFHTLTQSIPSRWIRWLDAPSPFTPTSSNSPEEKEKSKSGGSFFGSNADEEYYDHGLLGMPEEIREIVEAGGVDPREWVAEWVEEVLSLGVGVLAQRYVARRMGVGEGGIGRGKARMEEVLGDGGGEAARAGLI